MLSAAALAVAVAASPAQARQRQWPRLVSMRHLDGPWGSAFRRAEHFATRRGGRVSIALINPSGQILRYHATRPYYSASVVKAMLLVAYLNRRGIRGHRLSASSRALLHPMITRSDNGAATRAYSIVGARGLARVGRRAGMHHLGLLPGWADTRIAAGDQARFFYRIDALVPKRHRRYARHLLSHVIPAQRWGVPKAIPGGARAFFKGGWRPEHGGWLVHQVALVERGGRRVSIAVLTDHDRGFTYGADTIKGVAKRALGPLARP
ncbi:MAG: hypothetical protein QOG63_1463 [Thermoleophilaceae bacterium]|nr:hypothetical protein [Thermoleophilaceae bacterium]